MARGIRKFTRDMVSTQRENYPMAIGPFLGELAMSYNLSAGLIGEIIGIHEQTVHRWFLARSAPQPYALVKLAKVLCVLCWLRDNNVPAFVGSATQKRNAFAQHAREFLDQARSIK